MTSSLIKKFGTAEKPVEAQLLSAGPMSVELDGGALRYIRYDGREAIRAVSYVVRDEFWGTFNPQIENFKVEESADGFLVTYDASCGAGETQFRYSARITGSADGNLSFEATGAADADFPTNRTGFVVLHPVEGVAGYGVDVVHVDGQREQTRFPEIIDPKQPIMDIRSLAHEVCPGVTVTCTMNGDTFEMEDQRNWTDASYKTYVRPIDLPWPYTIPAGEKLEQSVTVGFAGSPRGAGGDMSAPIEVRVGERRGSVPRFGLAVETDDVAAALDVADTLAALRPSFVSAYFDAREDSAAEALAGFGKLSGLLGAELALEIIVPDDADPATCLGEIAGAAEAAGVSLAGVTVFWAGDLGFVMPGTVFETSEPFDRLYAAARAAFPGVALGGGSPVYFTELNRMPPPFDKLDFVSHGTCATVHAADDRSVTESLECLPYIIKTARALFGDKDYRVGPGAIGTRSSPFGGGPTKNAANERVTMTRRDPRQRALLGAAWHLGFAARMAEGGVDSVILGAAVGDYGLAHDGGAAPGYEDGSVYPAFPVMAAVYEASGRDYVQTAVSRPREVQALAFHGDDGDELWLANLMGEPRVVNVAGAELAGSLVTTLDEETFERCIGDPEGFAAGERRHEGGGLTLAPYGVARVRPAGGET